ncbi:MAG: ABC transporter ATP-binding protein [Planctomycetales bacterium]|nr:ABC transporter ATP-binding protein [Planctomycetales bacterium]
MTEATQASQPLLSLRAVRKTYRDGQVEALRGVSLDIAAGEFVSIMGPSGCGKSTLLHLLGGLDRPTTGEILYRGQPLDSVADIDRLRAREIGFVFQSFYLLPNLTALENVQIPMFEGPLPLGQRVAEARRLLALVGLQHRESHLPQQLSIGQRQRVAIARALANGPCLILADEPTGSLDSQSGQEILDILADLHRRQQTTLILVTHDPLVAERGQRLIRLLDGDILEDAMLSSPSGSAKQPTGRLR